MKNGEIQIKRLHDFNELADHCEQFMRDLAADFEARKNRGNELGGHVESCKTCTTAGCCYQLVTITIYEAIPIARKLRREGKSTVEYRQELRAIGEEMEGMPNDHWFNLLRPCVFLTPDKRCSIYEVRPAPCSTHAVVNSPSENCSPPFRRLPVLLVNNVQYSDVMLKANADLQRSFGLPEFPPLMGTFPKMLAVVLEAMTKPWDQFVQYIWEHGQLSKETLECQTSEEGMDFIMRQMELDEDVKSAVQSAGSVGEGYERAKRKADDR